jgi:hypothetical protein
MTDGWPQVLHRQFLRRDHAGFERKQTEHNRGSN